MAAGSIPGTSWPALRAEERERLFDRALADHGRALRRIAAAYEADPALQEDLLQDIALALWQALPRFRGDAALPTYVFRIAQNRAVSHMARRRARSAVDHPAGESAEQRPSQDPSPEESSVGTEMRRRLEWAVRQLRPSLRQALVLRLDGLGHREIAEILGLSENNVAVRLTRARGELRRLLEPAAESGGTR